MTESSTPTVKVRNPRLPDTYMIINQRDYRPAEHDLWEGEPEPPKYNATDSEATLAGRIAGKLIAQKDGLSFEAWLALKPHERAERMRAAEHEIDMFTVERDRGEEPEPRDAAEPSLSAGAKVGKGPGGRWFVQDADGKNLSRGFGSQPEAEAELTARTAG